MKINFLELSSTDLAFRTKIVSGMIGMISTSLLQVNALGFDYFSLKYAAFSALGQALVSIFVYRLYLTDKDEYKRTFKDRYINGSGLQLSIIEAISAALLGYLFTGFLYFLIQKVWANMPVLIVSILIGMFSEFFLQYRRKGKAKIDTYIGDLDIERRNPLMTAQDGEDRPKDPPR